MEQLICAVKTIHFLSLYVLTGFQLLTYRADVGRLYLVSYMRPF
jgi:hypothetical protein